MTECVKIKCDDCKFQENCVDYGWDGCKKFTHKPSEPQTNEEYIKSLNTEQLAEILLAIYQDGIDDCKQEWWKDTKEDFVEWLKQPHT